MTDPLPPAATASLALVNSDAINAAVKLGKDGVEVLERLHAIAKEERAATAKSAFVSAMADFRAEMPAIVKCVEGQHGTTRAGTRTKGLYAPLDAITPILDPIAARHGFSYRFDRDGKEWMLCIVSHRGGHEVASRYPLTVDSGPGRTAIQAVASGETYAKRYALLAAFAITTADPDDDGEAAGREAGDDAAPGDEALANLGSMLDEAPNPAAERGFLLAYLGRTAGRTIASLDDLTAAEAATALRLVTAKRARDWKS